MSFKLTSGELQDLHHYALACLKEENGVDAYSLKARLECIDSVGRIMRNQWDEEYPDELEIGSEDIQSEEQILAFGMALQKFTAAKCAELQIDGHSGNPIVAAPTLTAEQAEQIHCRAAQHPKSIVWGVIDDFGVFYVKHARTRTKLMRSISAAIGTIYMLENDGSLQCTSMTAKTLVARR